jgi:general secretion pathway protein D
LRIERDLPYSINYNVAFLTQHPVWETIESSINYIFDVMPVVEQDPIPVSSTSVSTESGIVATQVTQQQPSQPIVQRVSINQPAGIVSVHATKKVHAAVNGYLEQMKKNYESQVLIEAKVLEIQLSDSFQSGVDWRLVTKALDATASGGSGGSGGNTATQSRLSLTSGYEVPQGGAGGTSSFSIPVGKYDLNVIVSALAEFGQTKTLSSPRVHTINNQRAMLEFITPLVYFSVERDENGEDSNGNPKYTYTSTKQEDEQGVKLEITPTIDRESREIILNVIPELREHTGEDKEDPINTGNKIPIVVRRKIETSLKIKSGDVMVIGGLIQDKVNKTKKGVPFLKDIPIIGYFFGYNSYSKTLTETIIFIKATIVDEFNPLDERDRDILNKFDSIKR